MIEKRFTIKPQDDYFGITDNNTADKMNVINGIRTEIEAKWLCNLLNELHEENMNLRAKHTQMIIILKDVVNDLKRMDTYRYAEHLEKIANLRFLSEKELEE